MRNALNPLNEQSDIYLGSINEEDNSPEAIKARVMQHVRAIRYRARKEGENLNKAYNEFMGSQSGISSTEKQMVKERLGLNVVLLTLVKVIKEILSKVRKIKLILHNQILLRMDLLVLVI